MTGIIAIGVGCRKGCSGDALIALISQALAEWPQHVPEHGTRKLFTIDDKRDETGIRQAADLLGIELVFLSRAELNAAMPRTEIYSARAQQLFGVASVAEASALAGAGTDASLIVPRISSANATCAIAANLPSSGVRAS
ncbi:MAG: putative CobE protein [Tardiphaga sp.]|nr:putative CobE protein [Tardiphaga sp.]